MSTNFSIRPAESRDREDIREVAISSQLFRAEEVSFLDPMLDGYFDGTLSGHHWVVALAEGTVLAAAYYAPEPFSFRMMNLYFLAARATAQGAGVGSKVLSYVEGVLHELSPEVAQTLIVETSSAARFAGARRFYRKHGFSEEATVRRFYGQEEHKVVFWKSLMPESLETAPLGHTLHGSGPTRVVILNDWLGDTSTWEAARGLFDETRLSIAFADLRGYGRSRGKAGAFTVREAATDVLALADALGWDEFVVVGHSMSTLVALHLGQHHAHRVRRVALLTPCPPGGFGADEAGLKGSRGLALADDATRLAVFEERFGGRLSPGWTRFKAARWREAADPIAAAGYVAMFARDGLPDPSAPVAVPVLAITGEEDAPPMRSDAVTRALAPLCRELVVSPLPNVGHYPMQEMPPLTVALLERFLLG